jgi:hypothetical protein
LAVVLIASWPTFSNNYNGVECETMVLVRYAEQRAGMK